MTIPPLYRRLLSYARPYVFPHIVVMATAMLLLSATEGSFLVAIKHLGDYLQLSMQHVGHPGKLARDYEAVEIISAAVFGLFLLRAIAAFGSDFLEAYVTQKVMIDLRSALNLALQSKPLSFFNRTPTAVMLSRVVNDVQITNAGGIGSLLDIFSNSARLCAMLAAIIYLDWRLALCALTVFPAAILPVAKFSRQMRRMTRDAQKQLSGLAMLLQEAFQGNRVVKAFGMENYEHERFRRELKRLMRINMRAARIKAATGPIMEVMAAVAVVAAILWGAHSVMAGARTLGTFMSFIGAMLLAYRPFTSLTRTNNNLQAGLGAAERVFEMMDAPTDVPDSPEGLELPATELGIRFEHVHFRYGEEWVLRDINLTVEPGQMVALVGMSGGGKSTISDLIPRFYDVQHGRVLVGGIDVRRLKLSALRGRIGIVTQQTFLFNDTIRANIAYGSIDKRLEEVVAAARTANAHDFIMRLPDGYDTVVGELGVRLSGGERQRLAIARAILKNAPILILDEATSSLDSDAERQVQEALERLMENRTTLVIAHRLSTVRRADKIAVVVHGAIVEEGTHEELLTRAGEYGRLHKLQFSPVHELASNVGLTS
jgi:subfamily B ATP-binding cassette protein MsbA